MSAKRICMILADRDFPPDIRVEKEARALIGAGFEVTILCSHDGKRPLRNEWNGCNVIRVPSLVFLERKINTLYWFLARYDSQWGKTIFSVAKDAHMEVLHVHDLPLLGTALTVGKRLDIPVIADLHENYPAMLRVAYDEHNIPWHRWKLNDPDRWEVDEQHWISQAAHILVVVDEARDRLVSEGIPSSKISIIENTEDVDRFSNIELDCELLERFQSDFVISYIGGIEGPHRGVRTAIEAMPEIIGSIPNAKLLLVGDGDYRSELERFTSEQSLSDWVIFTGWQPFNKVPSFIASSEICLVPHLSNPHTEATSPHKLMQYMLMGKPVVVSSCRPLRRVVEETGSGLVFKAGDSHSLAQAVIGLKDKQLREKMGSDGKRAVQERYNWQLTAQKLIDLYEML